MFHLNDNFHFLQAERNWSYCKSEAVTHLVELAEDLGKIKLSRLLPKSLSLRLKVIVLRVEKRYSYLLMMVQTHLRITVGVPDRKSEASHTSVKNLQNLCWTFTAKKMRWIKNGIYCPNNSSTTLPQSLIKTNQFPPRSQLIKRVILCAARLDFTQDEITSRGNKM